MRVKFDCTIFCKTSANGPESASVARGIEVSACMVRLSSPVQHSVMHYNLPIDHNSMGSLSSAPLARTSVNRKLKLTAMNSEKP
jgi:hypothetical protein